MNGVWLVYLLYHCRTASLHNLSLDVVYLPRICVFVNPFIIYPSVGRLLTPSVQLDMRWYLILLIIV